METVVQELQVTAEGQTKVETICGSYSHASLFGSVHWGLLHLAKSCFMSGIRKMKGAEDTASFLLLRLFWEWWNCEGRWGHIILAGCGRDPRTVKTHTCAYVWCMHKTD